MQQPISTREHHPAAWSGLAWGSLGVLAFSFTVPLTRIAVGEGVPALIAGAGRSVIAAAIAGIVLLIVRPRLPRGRQWLQLGVVAIGIVLGFPLLTSLALTTTPASHGAVVIAVLPAATAVASVLRTGERPPVLFWVLAGLGAVAALGFAAVHGGSLGSLAWPDLLLLGAVVTAALGYAEGGILSRDLGSWQVVSWALVISAPVTLAITALTLSEPAVRNQLTNVSLTGWAAFAYLCAVSMYLGFFAWYRGLAIGPMTTVSQVQLIQPVISLIWAALLLGEHISLLTVLGGLIVIACTAATVRMRLKPVQIKTRRRP
ncbi:MULTISPECIES: DMT family transporter [Brevibacterium]|nr:MULTISPECIES: DMT family transporter [Brevibacterium]